MEARDVDPHRGPEGRISNNIRALGWTRMLGSSLAGPVAAGSSDPCVARTGSGVVPHSPLVEAVLDEVMREGSLHPAFRETVRRLVFDGNDAWVTCCGNDCDPCVLPMQRAVEAARRRLGV